jgi:hypothetical protein
MPPHAVEHKSVLLGGLAPTVCTVAASSTSKNETLTVSARGKTVRPETGWTRPTRYHHSNRCWTVASSRWQIGAQIQCSKGFTPMRCAEIAHNSTWRAEKRLPPPAAAASALYERVLLLGMRRGVAWSGHLLPVLEALQIVPVALRRDRSPQCGNHPIGESKCSRVALGAGSQWAVRTGQCHLAAAETTTAWRQWTGGEWPPLPLDVGTEPKALACHVVVATRLPGWFVRDLAHRQLTPHEASP